MTTALLEAPVQTPIKFPFPSHTHNPADHFSPKPKPGSTIMNLRPGPGPKPFITGHAFVAGGPHQENQTLAEILIDPTCLPFPDHHFDQIHCHAVLFDTPLLAPTLEEIYRVLQHGGFLSAQEPDIPSSYISPAHPQAPTMWDMLAAVLKARKANPSAGRHLKTLLMNAGFRQVTTSQAPQHFDAPPEVRLLQSRLEHWALSGQVSQEALDLGFTQEDFQRWHGLLERWASHPGASGCLQFGRASGQRPT